MKGKIMQLSIVDIVIIVAYFASMIVVGVWFSHKAAKGGIDSYFLADKSLPWYVLSVSHAAGMYDITGTMWLIYLCFVYGLKSVWIPWIYPMFIHIFYMVSCSVCFDEKQKEFSFNLPWNIDYRGAVVYMEFRHTGGGIPAEYESFRNGRRPGYTDIRVAFMVF